MSAAGSSSWPTTPPLDTFLVTLADGHRSRSTAGCPSPSSSRNPAGPGARLCLRPAPRAKHNRLAVAVTALREIPIHSPNAPGAYLTSTGSKDHSDIFVAIGTSCIFVAVGISRAPWRSHGLRGTQPSCSSSRKPPPAASPWGTCRRRDDPQGDRLRLCARHDRRLPRFSLGSSWHRAEQHGDEPRLDQARDRTQARCLVLGDLRRNGLHRGPRSCRSPHLTLVVLSGRAPARSEQGARWCALTSSSSPARRCAGRPG